MRRLIPLFAALFVAPLLGSDSPKEYDDATENIAIEGTWRLVELEYDGKITDSPLPLVSTYRDGVYTSKVYDKEAGRGRYRVDLAHAPAYLDEIPADGKTGGEPIKSIYQIDGDTLRVAYQGNLFMRRPQAFSGEGVWVEVYKRVK
jgi:uncharacterized protein (TIGR03067 family)